MAHNMAGHCSVCGVSIAMGRPRLFVGTKMLCAPAGECHRLGLLSASWRLTEAEARQLLDDDVAAAA